LNGTYAGNVSDAGCGLTGTKKYTGLYSVETNTAPQYYAFNYWTGIDCSGFIQRLTTAGKNLAIPGVACGIPDLRDVDNDGNHTDDGAIGTWQFPELDKTYYVFDNRSSVLKQGDILNYLSIEGAISHASLVYCVKGDSTGRCEDLLTGEYRILHASGMENICWNYRGRRRCTPDYDRRVTINIIYHDSRMTSDLDTPIGIGRIKLWE
jgi:hypothetical protein